MIVAGCSKDVPTKAVSSDDAWRHDVTLPVPVEFGASATPTKAAVESVNDLNNLKFGIFAFDKSFYAGGDLTEDDGVVMRNAEAKCVVSGGNASLELSQSWYYPIYSDRCFNFYSYHASSVSGWELTPTQALVNVSVGSVYDVLYAKAETSEPVYKGGEPCYGFNGAYIRAGGDVPEFVYGHPASSVLFKASISEPVTDMSVKLNSIHMLTPKTATLCVTDIVAPENEGTFVAAGEPVESIVIKGNPNTGALNHELTVDPATVSMEHFIVPGDEELTVKVEFSVIGPGSDKVIGTPDDIAQKSVVTTGLKAGEDGAVFEKGKRYVFLLKVTSPKNVLVTLEGVDEYTSAFGGGAYNPDLYK